MIPLRFRILKPWLLGLPVRPQHHVPAGEVLKYLFQPGKEARGRKYLQSLEEQEDCWTATFSGHSTPLNFPKSMPLEEFFMVVDETFRADHWHQYQIPQTTVKPEDIVVDCGAAEGLFTLKAAAVCQRVYAIEPLPAFAATLTRSFGECSNVTVIPVAAGASSGTAFLAENTISSAVVGRNTGVEISVLPLDEILANEPQPVTYLKADVEGSEAEVLRGARETIQRGRPRVVLACYHGANDPSQLEDELRAIHPDYQFLRKGLSEDGKPIVLHAW